MRFLTILNISLLLLISVFLAGMLFAHINPFLPHLPRDWYKLWWFNVLLGALGISIFCTGIVRLSVPQISISCVTLFVFGMLIIGNFVRFRGEAVVYKGQKGVLATSNLRDEISVYIISKSRFPPVEKLFTEIVSFHPARSFNINKTIAKTKAGYHIRLIKSSPQKGMFVSASCKDKEICKWVKYKDEEGSNFEFAQHYINVKYLPIKHRLKFGICVQEIVTDNKPKCRIVFTTKRRRNPKVLEEGKCTFLMGHIVRVVNVEKDRVRLKIYKEPVFTLLPFAGLLISLCLLGKLLHHEQ